VLKKIVACHVGWLCAQFGYINIPDSLLDSFPQWLAFVRDEAVLFFEMVAAVADQLIGTAHMASL